MQLDPALVERARSTNWSDRAQAGQELVDHVGHQEPDALLMELLLDCDDTAVVARTASSLLDRGDTPAWRLFAAAWNLADSSQADQLMGALSNALFSVGLVPSKSADLRNIITLLADDADGDVRNGAIELRGRIIVALADSSARTDGDF
jgi:hypothetical protein